MRGILGICFSLFVIDSFLGYPIIGWVRKETMKAVYHELKHHKGRDLRKFTEEITGLKWNPDPKSPIFIPVSRDGSRTKGSEPSARSR